METGQGRGQSGALFTETNRQEYLRDGYTVIRGAFSPNVTSTLLQRLEEMIQSWDLEMLRKQSKPFVTYDQANRSSDEWFLTSGDVIRPFFEEEGEKAVVNKIGHGLHELDPLFRQLVHSRKVEDILRGIGYESPVPIQSMYIAKSAKVGGEVTAHQDSTFLVTDPHSVCGVWIALKKATVENGCMFFVKGSHHSQPIDRLFLRDEKDFGRTVFTPPNPPPYDLRGACAVEADVGDVVVFHGSVIHYSAPNRSNIHRPAYVMHFSERKCGWHPRNWLQSRFFQPLYGLRDYRVPVIDISKRNADTERAWDLAMSQCGCAIVVGHGVPLHVIAELKRLAKEFFAKSEKFKNKFRSGGYGDTGYNSFASEAVADVNKSADPIESFYLKQGAPHVQELNDLLQACYRYRDAVDEHLLMPLLRLSARALGLKEEEALVAAHKDHFRTLKLSNYPGQKESTVKKSAQSLSRYGAHTDWEGFTLLLPDEQDDWENGMETLLPSVNRWISVGPPPPNAFVVNAGDFIPIWTRGRWHSPVHRVMASDVTRDRFSIPYFSGPNLLSTVRPVVEDMLEDLPHIEPVIAGEWLGAKIARAKI